MKVKAIHAFAGDRFSIKPGELIEMSDKDAARFIAAGAGVAADKPADTVRVIPESPKPPAAPAKPPAK
jgi:hypothetical protein